MTEEKRKDKGRSLSLREEKSNILQQAIQGLSEEGHRELMEKAAEEALHVHVDAAQREVKSNAASREMHEHINTVERLNTGRTLSGHHVKSEIETGSGKMTINSRKGPGCFVATAIFENENSAEVASFRRFRDTVLTKNRPGRRFIDWYNRNGPALAEWIEYHPRVKRVVRIVLLAIAKMLK